MEVMKAEDQPASDAARTLLDGSVRDGTKTVRGARHATESIQARVTKEEFAIVERHQKNAGYESLAEYVRAVCVAPKAVVNTSGAADYAPLAPILYLFTRAVNATDATAKDEALAKAHRALTDFVCDTGKTHKREVAERGVDPEDWERGGLRR